MNEVVPITQAKAGEIAEAILLRGDYAKLTEGERAKLVVRQCESLGMNPLTQPIRFLNLSGRVVPYVTRDGTDQLRKIHKVSVVEMRETSREDVHIVTCKVQDASGRTDVSTGAVKIAGLKGDALANALMKAETKAKRRATLSICGLGFLDETEIETIPGGPEALHDAWGERAGQGLINAARAHKSEPAAAVPPSPSAAEAPEPVTPHVTAQAQPSQPPALQPADPGEMPTFLKRPRKSAATDAALANSGVLAIYPDADKHTARIQGVMIAVHNRAKTCATLSELAELDQWAMQQMDGLGAKLARSAIIEWHRARIARWDRDETEQQA